MSLPRPSHYEILGVAETADKVTIRKAAYRQLQCWHPNKYLSQDWITSSDHDVCLEISKRINAASGTLLNDEERRKYDLLRRQGADTEGLEFYNKWKELQERMDFYIQHQAKLERFLAPLHQEKAEMKNKLKQSESKLDDANRNILSLQQDKIDLSEQKAKAEENDKHRASALRNAEFLLAKQEKELEMLDKKVKQQEKQLKEQESQIKEMATIAIQREQQIKTLTEQAQQQQKQEHQMPVMATTPPQPKMTSTSPSLFQSTATGKFVCPGLVGIRLRVDVREKSTSVHGLTLLFSDKNSIEHLRNFIKFQKPYPIYRLESTREIYEWEHDPIFGMKDNFKSDFEFFGNSRVLFESKKYEDKYTGYILLREFEKYVETAVLLRDYWDVDKNELISEASLPADLQPSAFYNLDKTAPQAGKK